MTDPITPSQTTPSQTTPSPIDPVPPMPRMPILRVMPRPADINANGHIFGGWVLSQMDIAAGVVAGRRAGGPVAGAQRVWSAVRGVRGGWLG